MRDVEERARHSYRHLFHEEPQVVASAPGRVNLIGEHTDYSGGFALPCAIDRRVAIALGRGHGGLYSDDFKERQALNGCRIDGWAAYPRGVTWALIDRAYEVGKYQAAFAGTVPIAAGLSSSAAIEVATALALDAEFHLEISSKRLAKLCQHAENRFVGVSSGILDQYASLLCRDGEALLIDCRSLESEAVPLDLEAAGLQLLICDTRVKRALGATAYNDRRASTDDAAKALGIESLRDAEPGDVSRLSGDLQRRARHVVTENRRVLDGVKALQAHDFTTFGELMNLSHASLRDDYDVSVPELDTFVEAARQSGSLGARLTGAGFGGSAVALLQGELNAMVQDTARQAFAKKGFNEPRFYIVQPSAGAEVVS
ncbi:MAG: galactokinase [Chloroflexota bacterium]